MASRSGYRFRVAAASATALAMSSMTAALGGYGFSFTLRLTMVADLRGSVRFVLAELVAHRYPVR